MQANKRTPTRNQAGKQASPQKKVTTPVQNKTTPTPAKQAKTTPVAKAAVKASPKPAAKPITPKVEVKAEEKRQLIIPSDSDLFEDQRWIDNLKSVLVYNIGMVDLSNAAVRQSIDSAVNCALLLEHDDSSGRAYLKFESIDEAKAAASKLSSLLVEAQVQHGMGDGNEDLTGLCDQLKCTIPQLNFAVDEQKPLHFGVLIKGEHEVLPDSVNEALIRQWFPAARSIWIPVNTTTNSQGIYEQTKRYAFVDFETAEEAAAGLEKFDGKLASGISSDICVVNYGEVRDGTLEPWKAAEKPTKLGLSNDSRRMFIAQIDVQIENVKHTIATIKTNDNAENRQQLTQQRTLIQRIVFMLNKNKVDRQKAKTPLPDTKEQQTLITSAVSKVSALCKEIDAKKTNDKTNGAKKTTVAVKRAATATPASGPIKRLKPTVVRGRPIQSAAISVARARLNLANRMVGMRGRTVMANRMNRLNPVGVNNRVLRPNMMNNNRPNMNNNQAGNMPNMNQAGNRPNMNQGGNRPNMNQSGNRPNMNQAGNRPNMNQAGNRQNMNQAGNRPNMNQAGNRPNMNQAGNRQNMNQVGNRPNMNQAGNRPNQGGNRANITLTGNRPNTNQGGNMNRLQGNVNRQNQGGNMNRQNQGAGVNRLNMNRQNMNQSGNRANMNQGNMNRQGGNMQAMNQGNRGGLSRSFDEGMMDLSRPASSRGIDLPMTNTSIKFDTSYPSLSSSTGNASMMNRGQDTTFELIQSLKDELKSVSREVIELRNEKLMDNMGGPTDLMMGAGQMRGNFRPANNMQQRNMGGNMQGRW